MKNKFLLVYKTKTTPFFPICLVAKEHSTSLKKFSGLNFVLPVIPCVVKNDITHWFFAKSLEKIAKIHLNKLINNQAVFNRFLQQEKYWSNKLLQDIKKPVENLFTQDRKRLNPQGKRKIKAIFRHYAEYGYWLDVPGFWLQVFFTDEIKKTIFQSFPNKELTEKQKIFNLLLANPDKTNYENYESDLYYHLRNKTKNQNIESLVKKYFWLIHDYVGPIIDQDYIVKDLQKFKNKGLKKIYQELNNVDQRLLKQKAYLKLMPESERKKIKRAELILYLYSEKKKKVLNQVNIFIRKCFEYKYPGISLEKLHKIYQLSPDEIIDILVNDLSIDIEKRAKEFVYEIKNSVIKHGSQKYLKLVDPSRSVKQLHGQSASPGTTCGQVQVILNPSQINKFKPGNILVAPFTNVNYLPIMKKASAILTETGGLTSHAAVVSREMKVPCIVGIKNLLDSLADGDQVEVDANKGAVQKIK